MLRVVAICVLFMSAEVFGNAQKKTESKYPKKYSREFIITDKVKIKDQFDNSYNSYKVSGPTDPIDLPPIYYEFYSVLQNPENKFGNIESPSDYIIPPEQDSYTVFEDRPTLSLIVPKSDLHLIKKYVGYTDSNGEYSDSLRAPLESSYSEVQPLNEGLIFDDFQPPKLREETVVEPESSYLNYEPLQQKDETAQEPESSYLNYEPFQQNNETTQEPESSYLSYEPATSSYTSYDLNVNATDLTSIRPPPPPPEDRDYF